jgi:hypothetical protein
LTLAAVRLGSPGADAFACDGLDRGRYFEV